MRNGLMRVLMQEDLNFLLTNRLPRRWATTLVGRVAAAEHPVVAKPALAAWRFFCDVDLSDAATTQFASLRDGFIRGLREGARAFAPGDDVVASPCDAIVGAHGRVEDGQLYQVKGFPYRIDELVPDAEAAARFADGWFVTLRLTAGMYHRFHAPADMTVDSVTYQSGDCWNVNPIALKRVERLFCRNERAVIAGHGGTRPLLLVPVAAILVASIRLTFLDTERTLREHGPGTRACDVRLEKGAEMGWFEHGSTIVMFLPAGARLRAGLREGQAIRAGEAIADW
ncbi:phosphatidylserine decarboxylase [Sphingomonas sp. BE138]|uniref:archaetidylserine decarboxylase n=1 Tax=Sphingomonas sp. BE138 TaxID=2817845 RepID=UPI00285E653F|nr:archaetidylserine decarboxylase [Sphingomonas sp. BE138]MDR6786714.1 phosphatidylserine decarboxylase [Sphingomonas sp. BE138]